MELTEKVLSSSSSSPPPPPPPPLLLLLLLLLFLFLLLLLILPTQAASSLGMYSSPSSLYHLFAFDYARVFHSHKDTVPTTGVCVGGGGTRVLITLKLLAHNMLVYNTLKHNYYTCIIIGTLEYMYSCICNMYMYMHV